MDFNNNIVMFFFLIYKVLKHAFEYTSTTKLFLYCFNNKDPIATTESQGLKFHVHWCGINSQQSVGIKTL